MASFFRRVIRGAPVHSRPSDFMLAIVCPLLAAATIGSDELVAAFNTWKVKYGKTYATAELESAALSAYATNDRAIMEHNSKGLSWALGHNAFSDVTTDTFMRTRLGFHKPTLPRPRPYDWSLKSTVPANKTVDWVKCV